MDENNYSNYNRRPRKKRGITSYLIIGIISAVIGGIASSYIAPLYLYGKVLPLPPIYNLEKTGVNNEININPSEDISAVSAVAKKTMSSVVGITTVQMQSDWFLEEGVEGVGSGVIVDKRGYILTNSHVIGDGQARRINVLFENGDNADGEVLWNDAALDLAVIKVMKDNLPVAEIGDSDTIDIGQLAVAIGNPLGLDFQRTVTSGVISGLNRTIQIDEFNIMEDLIQTDASINPGNSGGPLLNSQGQVIGLNTAKIKGGEGIGFAVPINIIKPILEQVIEKGSFETVYIGFKGVEVERYEREAGVKLEAERGAVILQIIEGSAAEKANLKPMDIIVEMDNEKIEGMTQLRKKLYNYKKGDKSILKIKRDGKEKEVEITF